jgi:G3E family GTPase
MKTTIVCGLLGSGKTTFIRSIVKHGREKTVVLVNDFGAAGIDGEIFSAGGIESVELPSGCVCCTLKFDLITTIQRIVKEFAPERLLIEPSGVASPSGVLDALQSAGEGSASVIGIVDVTEFVGLYDSGIYGSFFQDQIENSDVILVNKTDLADEAVIVAAERLITSINPRAVLLRTAQADFSAPLPEAPLHRDIYPRACDYHFETESFPIVGRPALADFTSFFAELAGDRFGSVARAKALVSTMDGPYRFDSTYGRVDRVRFEKDIENSRLVIIGEGLAIAAILQRLASCSSLLPWKEVL